MNTCDSRQFPGKIHLHRNQFVLELQEFTVLKHPKIKKTITFKHFHCCALGVIATVWILPFSSFFPTFRVHHPINTLAEALQKGSHIVQHGFIWITGMFVAVCASVCEDYLTIGMVVTRKWPGLVGRGGLMPRGGVCEGVVVLSALKVFISWATRPRPAQVGALPDDPASSKAALRGASNSPSPEKRGEQISLRARTYGGQTWVPHTEGWLNFILYFGFLSVFFVFF